MAQNKSKPISQENFKEIVELLINERIKLRATLMVRLAIVMNLLDQNQVDEARKMLKETITFLDL